MVMSGTHRYRKKYVTTLLYKPTNWWPHARLCFTPADIFCPLSVGHALQRSTAYLCCWRLSMHRASVCLVCKWINFYMSVHRIVCCYSTVMFHNIDADAPLVAGLWWHQSQLLWPWIFKSWIWLVRASVRVMVKNWVRFQVWAEETRQPRAGRRCII